MSLVYKSYDIYGMWRFVGAFTLLSGYVTTTNERFVLLEPHKSPVLKDDAWWYKITLKESKFEEYTYILLENGKIDSVFNEYELWCMSIPVSKNKSKRLKRL